MHRQRVEHLIPEHEATPAGRQLAQPRHSRQQMRRAPGDALPLPPCRSALTSRIAYRSGRASRASSCEQQIAREPSAACPEFEDRRRPPGQDLPHLLRERAREQRRDLRAPSRSRRFHRASRLRHCSSPTRARTMRDPYNVRTRSSRHQRRSRPGLPPRGARCGCARTRRASAGSWVQQAADIVRSG